MLESLSRVTKSERQLDCQDFFEVLVGETVKARWMEKCLKHHSCAYHSHVKMGGLGLPMFTTKSLAIKAMNIPNFGKQNDATKC